MGRNTGNGSRIGVTGNRSQTYNSTTDKFIKRDTTTGRFISCKDTPYKSIRRDEKAKQKDDELKQKVITNKDKTQKPQKKPIIKDKHTQNKPVVKNKPAVKNKPVVKNKSVLNKKK